MRSFLIVTLTGTSHTGLIAVVFHLWFLASQVELLKMLIFVTHHFWLHITESHTSLFSLYNPP